MAWRSVFTGCELSLFIHGTEDREKLLNAILTTLGVRLERLREELLEGHFKNPIILVKANLQGKEAEALARKVLTCLDEIDKARLREALEDFVDKKGKLYVRLDKQELVQGRLKLCEQDPVRLIIKPGSRLKKDRLIEEVKTLLKAKP